MAQRDERLYFAEILEAIDRFVTYTNEGREAFFGDAMIQDAVIRNIEIIGEAVRGVSQSTRQAHPEIPWSSIAGTRDRVIHGYFEVDLEIIWEIVEKELTGLRQQIAPLLQSS
jgi:uncharacterized protein with HEPN domain